MNLQVLIKWLSLALSFLIFFFAIKSGITSAKTGEQSRSIAVNVQTLETGLKYFLQDFDRLPQNAEFFDSSLMLNYFSSFPPKSFISEQCADTFIYKRKTLSEYEINFCLPADFEKFRQGWNITLNEQK